MTAKILVVEDEGIEALSLQQKLKARGYSVPEIVYTGEDAVKKTAQISPDLVLMDIMLHGEMDGITAAEQIHASFDIPIIYITAYADDNTLKRAKITEPYGYIVKPFKERELLISIEMALYKHKIERDLKESRRLLEITLKSIVDGVIATDKTGLITFMNPIAENLIGLKQEEALNKQLKEVFKLINRSTRQPAENRITMALEGLTTCRENHILLIAKSGKEIPIDSCVAPIKDDNGKSLGTILVFCEATKREKMQVALRESEERLRIAKEAAQLGVYDYDVSSRTLQWDERVRQLWGVEPDVPITYEVFISGLNPDDRAKMKAAVNRTLDPTSNGEYHTEYRVISRADGIERWVTTTGQVFFEQRRPIRLIGIIQDITEHKRAEEALLKAHDECEMRVQDRTSELEKVNKALKAEIEDRKRAEEQIREQAALLDNAQEAIGAIGIRSLDHNLIYWNKGAERLYGWTAKEAMGKDPVKFLFKDKEEPSQLIEAKRIVLDTGEWTGELHQITKDGREIDVESHWTLIYDSEGKPKSILVINTDITEKKKIKRYLLRVQRMESIGTLAGGIAHDLNNMLTPMMMSVRILKEKLKDEQSQKLITILEKNSERSANLIKQVLSFSRGVEGEYNPLQIKHIITEIEKIVKETFPRNIEIRTDIQKDIFTISGDATQLHQVIMNLCVNARDAMTNGGILNISAENFFIDKNYLQMHTEAKVGSYISITVSDTGIGIPPKILDRIFEPFFTTKEFGKGTGLGLSTAHAIVKSHNGFINVYSEVGKGTTFSVYLPAIKTEMQNVEEQKLELPVGHGELVLVAEDEDSVREITVSTLEAYEYKVLTANDGVDAVVLYAQNKDKIKVVLMDMMMPVMDGEASIRAIRKINPEVNIIVVSGLAEKDKLAKIERILQKPYTAERLLKTIHEALSAKLEQ
jgi:two-component system cell cycle sensor histidine kinase/response regulator CckA